MLLLVQLKQNPKAKSELQNEVWLFNAIVDSPISQGISPLVFQFHWRVHYKWDIAHLLHFSKFTVSSIAWILF